MNVRNNRDGTKREAPKEGGVGLAPAGRQEFRRSKNDV